MAMLFSYPLFSVSTYIDVSDSFDISLSFMAELDGFSDDFTMLFDGFVIQ
jgi:hypothetical protein